jgi:hypothetical protein
MSQVHEGREGYASQKILELINSQTGVTDFLRSKPRLMSLPA